MSHLYAARHILAFLAIPVFLGADLSAQGEAPKAPPEGLLAKSWDHYHSFPALEQLMRDMQKQWPRYIKMRSLGKSFQKRDIWCLEVNDPDTGPIESKPAMYVDANIHGNEVQGGETALYMIWYILKFKDSTPKLAKLFQRVSFYILPTVNPDGRAYWFDAPNTSSSSRGGQIPTDNDGDGKFDEDGPNDLNGDGHITRMRKKVPLGEGTSKLDPDDPRILVRVPRGEKGDYIQFWSEGIDDDGDGRINEDGPGGYDPNRDWGSDWKPSWIQGGARPLPFNLPESRVVRDFMLSCSNITGVQAYHNTGGMILRGPGNKDVKYPSADLRVYDEIGKKGEALLPFYDYKILWRDLYGVHGGFLDWTYLGLGIMTFSNELWTGKRRNQNDARMTQKESLEWEDRMSFGAHFVPWKEYQHPTYGKIEIGGSTKDTRRIPPSFLIQEGLHRNSAFILYQCSEFPELSVGPTKVVQGPGDLRYVTITIENKKLTPTRTAHAAAKKLGKPDLLFAKPHGCKIISAAIPTNAFHQNEATLLPENSDPMRIPLESGVPSRGKVQMRYLVSGRGSLEFRYEAEKAKNLSFKVDV